MFRIYYNRHSDYPYIWSIDAGTLDTEVRVKSVQCHRVSLETGFDPDVAVGDQERPRVFFIARYCTLIVKDGVACFFHDPDWRKPKLDAPTE